MRGREAICLVLIVFSILTLNTSLIVATVAGGAAEAWEPATRPTNRGKLKLAAPPSGAVTGPDRGALLLCSVSSPEIRGKFLKLAGGSEAKIVMVVNHVPDTGDPADAERRVARTWGVAKVTFWWLTDRQSAEDKVILGAIRDASGLWIPGGRPPEYLDALIDSSAHRELTALLSRGGVIGGESAGAVVQSTFVAPPSGAPYAGPALEGLGFARNLAIFPHFGGASAKFPPQFCQRLIAEHQGLAGLALPDGSAVIVRGKSVEVVGKGVELIWRAMDGNITTTTYVSASHFTLPEDIK